MAELSIIFAADIFGVSQEFKNLCQQISLVEPVHHSVNAHIVGPYQVQPKSFESEKQAYQYFIEQGVAKNVVDGVVESAIDSSNATIENALAAYSQKLLTTIENIKGPKLLIGFSVGGSAIWQLMPKLPTNEVLSATCFYSGQIRYMTDVTPTVPVQLIFPISEQHFSVTKLMEKIQIQCASRQFNIDIEQCTYLHGFLNELSVNYHESGTKQNIKIIQNQILQILG